MKNDLKKRIEALLFVAGSPLKEQELIKINGFESLEKGQFKELIDELNAEYEQHEKPFFIKSVAGGYRYYIKEAYFQYIESLLSERRKSKLTQKGLETLAIIAFKQPITKPQVEAIRGVSADGVMRTLLERNLIQVMGRSDAPGRPLLYGTTEEFLEYFGLNSLDELPKLKEIEEILQGDSSVRKQIGDVILKEIVPETYGMVVSDDDLIDLTTREKEEENEPDHAGMVEPEPEENGDTNEIE